MSNTFNFTIIGATIGLVASAITQSVKAKENNKNLNESAQSNSVKVSTLLRHAFIGGSIGAVVGLGVDVAHEEEFQKLFQTKKGQKKVRVFEKAKPVLLENPYRVRKDKYGKVIRFDEYGNRKADGGWEVDHSKPKSKGGTDHINNLQPLHWKNNVQKSNRLGFKP